MDHRISQQIAASANIQYQLFRVPDAPKATFGTFLTKPDRLSSPFEGLVLIVVHAGFLEFDPIALERFFPWRS